MLCGARRGKWLLPATLRVNQLVRDYLAGLVQEADQWQAALAELD